MGVWEKPVGGEHLTLSVESHVMKSSTKLHMGANSSMIDSGLVVVVFIITSLILITFTFLLLVDYEWCHVLYKNNTENPLCTKNNNRDKLLLTSLADQIENKKRKEILGRNREGGKDKEII